MRFTLLFLLAMGMGSSVLQAQRGHFSSINFQAADSMAQVYKGYSIHNLPELAHRLTAPLATDVEKFRALYRWICFNIENDYALFQNNQEMREQLVKSPAELQTWNTQFAKEVFETLRKKKRTICTGYAYLLREMATHAGIECMIIDGYGRTVAANIGGPGTPNHSWNAINLNNQWYVCDATWSSGAIEMTEKKFIKQYNDAYFLAEPSTFISNHYPMDTAHMFIAQKPTLQEFLNRPLIYSGLYDQHITNLHPDTFTLEASLHQPVHFQFTAPEDKAYAVQIVDKGMGEKKTKVPAHYNNGTLLFDYSFTSRGLHTVHILLNDVLVTTYSVTVTKK